MGRGRGRNGVYILSCIHINALAQIQSRSQFANADGSMPSA